MIRMSDIQCGGFRGSAYFLEDPILGLRGEGLSYKGALEDLQGRIDLYNLKYQTMFYARPGEWNA